MSLFPGDGGGAERPRIRLKNGDTIKAWFPGEAPGVPTFQGGDVAAQISMGLTNGMSAAEQAVAAVLHKHVGKHRAICRGALCEATGLSDRQARAAVASLVSVHQCAIGTNPRGGYYLIATSKEIAAEAAKLVSYIRQMARRLNSLVGGEGAKKLLGQAGLFEGKDEG